ncbi:hypothetical protein D3C84_1225630 [compost metagenome]
MTAKLLNMAEKCCTSTKVQDFLFGLQNTVVTKVFANIGMSLPPLFIRKEQAVPVMLMLMDRK